MNVYLIMRNAADVLTVARRARLGGDIVRAQRLESKAERILGQLKAAGSDLGDKLLTAWEGSLESSPAFLKDWQSAYSLDDLLQLSVIDEEECKRRLDAAHTRGPVRHPEPCAYDCGDCAKCRAFGEWADEQD